MPACSTQLLSSGLYWVDGGAELSSAKFATIKNVMWGGLAVDTTAIAHVYLSPAINVHFAKGKATMQASALEKFVLYFGAIWVTGGGHLL